MDQRRPALPASHPVPLDHALKGAVSPPREVCMRLVRGVLGAVTRGELREERAGHPAGTMRPRPYPESMHLLLGDAPGAIRLRVVDNLAPSHFCTAIYGRG